MSSLRERQVHMTQLIKKLDRMVVEKHGRFNVPFYHYQKPLAAPGERDSVCVYVDAVRREYLPYGIELEKMVEEARLWVKTGEGPRPEVVVVNQAITLAREAVGSNAKTAPESEVQESEPSAGNRRPGVRRRLMNTSDTAANASLTKTRLRPPAK